MNYFTKYSIMFLVEGYNMKKAINIRMDETLLTDLDSYASELERSRTYI